MDMNVAQFWNDYYKQLPYTEEYFRDNRQLEKWTRVGHNIASTTIHIHPITNQQDIIDNVSKYFDNLSHIGVCFHRLSPGHYLPDHQDRYGFYSREYGVTDLNTIKRYVIFAEDWQPGHFLTVNNKVYSNWKAGDVVGWTGTTTHSAINVGNKYRYTIQVTGVLNG